MKDNNKIIIFDTTLRDGEKSPGASMNTAEKIQIARQLEKLNVDVIEAGFAAASPGDFDAISQIAKTIQIKNKDPKYFFELVFFSYVMTYSVVLRTLFESAGGVEVFDQIN